ncbi:MAG: hypothetical protein IPO81_13740 [Kouleothrix sp.]|nr:hypothetical protein [Kouleothrix sp.]
MARFVSADGVVPGAGALTAWPSDATAAPLFAQGPKDKDGNPTAPHNPQTLNRYSYGWNNPVRNTDPTGHCSSGLSWGMVNGQCYQEAFQQYMDPSRSLTDRAIGFIYAQADIALVSVATVATYGLGSAVIGGGAAVTAEAGGATTVTASKVDPNKLIHIFDKAEHALDEFVSAQGGREQAFRAIQDAANQALREGKLVPGPNGIIPSGNAGPIIDVGGTQIRLIGGRVIDDVVQISSASRQGL